MSVERTNKISVWILIGFIFVLPLLNIDCAPKENIELRKGIAVKIYVSATPITTFRVLVRIPWREPGAVCRMDVLSDRFSDMAAC